MLQLKNLTKRFGPTYALKDMSFTVPDGEVFGFLGPNGAGKTTAMRAIFGLIKLDSGEVLWRNKNISQADKKTLGYMPEERGLYPKMTVQDQLIYIGRLHGLDARTAHHRAKILIEELQIQGGGSVKIESLSLGNRQRCQIAATLIHEPELLVLDEPFSGLDPISIDIVRNILLSYASLGRTVLFSSHQLEMVENFCQSVAIANHGHIAVADRIENLTTSTATLILKVREDPKGTFLDSISGIKFNKLEDESLQVELSDDTDPNIVLQAAMKAGTLERYEFARRPLSSVFKSVIHSSVNN